MMRSFCVALATLFILQITSCTRGMENAGDNEKMVKRVEKDGLIYKYYQRNPVGHTIYGPNWWVDVMDENGNKTKTMTWQDADEITQNNDGINAK